ncbi:hypothetical protein Tco_1327197 [Tanacetum coccineum]
MQRPSMSRVVAMLSGDIEASGAITRPEYLTGFKFNDATTFISAPPPSSSDSGPGTIQSIVSQILLRRPILHAYHWREIISGRPNCDSSLDDEKIYLLEWAWDLHEANNELELVDEVLSEFDENEVLRVMRVALLCTQTSPMQRPSMSRVVAMLSGDIEASGAITRPEYLTGFKFNDATTFISAPPPSSSDSGPGTNQSIVSQNTASRPILHDIIGEEGCKEMQLVQSVSISKIKPFIVITDMDEMDGNAISNLHLALADEVLSSIEEKKSAKEIWDHLARLYEARSLHNKNFLKRKLYALCMTESTSVTEHVNNLNTLFSQLTYLSFFDDVAAAILEEENRRNNREDMQTSSRQVEALVVTRGRSMEPGSSGSHNQESILKNTIECNLNPSDGPGKPNSIIMKTVKTLKTQS